MRCLILALALAACTAQPPQQTDAPATIRSPGVNSEDALASMPSWDGARAAGVDFRAVGQEPGWMLDQYSESREGELVLLWDYGEHLQRFPAASVIFPQDGAQHLETQADGHILAVTIRRAQCEDAMSGEAFPASVEIVIDGRTLSGCGRTV